MISGFSKVSMAPAYKIPDAFNFNAPDTNNIFTEKEKKLLNLSDKIVRQLIIGNKGKKRKIVKEQQISIMYLEIKNKKIFVLSIDWCLFGYKDIEKIKAPIINAFAVSKEQIIVLPTHCHVGLELDWDILQRIILKGTKEAINQSRNVEIASCIKNINISKLVVNRRVNLKEIGTRTVMFNDYCNIDSKGLNVTGQINEWLKDLSFGTNTKNIDYPIYADKQTDPELSTIFFRDIETKKIIGSFTNFACHAVIVSQLKAGGDISADYPGYLKEKLETNLGGIALFGQGASGDLKPITTEYTHSQAKVFGNKLAEEILVDVESLEWKDVSYCNFKIKKIYLPLRKNTEKIYNNIDAEIDKVEKSYNNTTDIKIRSELQVKFRYLIFLKDEANLYIKPEWMKKNIAESLLSTISLNDITILSVPGEVFSSTKQFVKNAIDKNKKVLFCTIANEDLYYLTPKEEFEKGGYEAGVCLIDPNFLQKEFIDKIIEILD